MGGYHSFYSGGMYGSGEKESVTEDYALNLGYQLPASQFAPTTDPRTSNQIQAVSGKISTGAKTIDVQSIDANALDYIPKQHLDEINKLRKLAGVELTFHGPLVEPTGISRNGWDDTQRQESERKIINAIQKGHQLDPKGNIVITFHSGVANLEPEQRVWDEKKKKEIVTDFWYVDENSGQFGQGNLMKKRYFPGEEGDTNIKEELKKTNEEKWNKDIQSLNFHALQGSQILDDALKFSSSQESMLKNASQRPEKILELYKNYGDPKTQEEIKKIDELTGGLASEKIQRIVHGGSYIKDAYSNLKVIFNDAYANAEKKAEETGNNRDLEILKDYKKEIAPLIKNGLDDPKNIDKLSHEVLRGFNVLSSIEAPERLKPLKEFMIEKSAETFSNAALSAYKQFKDTAPVISIENAPAGTAALSRAEDLKELIETAQSKFIQKAKKELNMSEESARKQAQKMIGATWDVGHINMIRRFGYEEKHVVEESKKIAPHVKHVHLSDNFGIEHTELPMGMGTVPIKKILALHENFRKVKKTIETGGWFKDFKTTPLRETLSAFGSPIYAMQMAPAWQKASYMSGGYFAGYGNNPDVHHSIYGAGFAGLPVELGGQIQGRSRISGTPME